MVVESMCRTNRKRLFSGIVSRPAVDSADAAESAANRIMVGRVGESLAVRFAGTAAEHTQHGGFSLYGRIETVMVC